MSTIEVANYANEDGSKSVGADYVIDGSAKAWAYYNQTVPSVGDSLNVSSITDASTGTFAVSFTNSFSSVAHASVGTAVAQGVKYLFLSGPDSNSASSVRFSGRDATDVPHDVNKAGVADFGDLA